LEASGDRPDQLLRHDPEIHGDSYLQLHECRHSYSSFLAAAGIPKERRDLYRGHADHSMEGRYTHQLDASHLDDARTFSDYLRKADTPTRLKLPDGTVTFTPDEVQA
jgi:integrase